MKLDAKMRSAIPTQDFAGPDRSFPIEDANHARAALSMAHNAANPAAIKAAVHAKYPSIGNPADEIKSRLKGMAMKKMGIK